MINNLKKGYDCASTLKDILERKQIIDNYHLTGYYIIFICQLLFSIRFLYHLKG